MQGVIDFLNNLGLLDIIIVSLGISAMALAVVYIPGRMLNIIKSYRIKNIIAFFIMVASTYFYLKVYKTNIENVFKFWYSYLIHISIAIIIYTIFGMRLFDRMDSWLDKKGMKDKEQILGDKKKCKK